MPTVIYVYGLRFFFYSEEHLPIHIHVVNGDGKAKIDVEKCTVISNSGLKPKDLKRALDVVNLFKDYIIEAWDEHFDE